MKKFLLSIIALLCCSLSVSAAGQYQTEADRLYQMGLFRGTDKGYRLEKNFTRAEGATMLVRLLGKEKQALAAVAEVPFADMDGHWAAPYVAYCYTHDITKGTGDNTFSPEAQMTAAEYVALLLRSLGYESVEPDNADIAAAEYALTDSSTIRQIFSDTFTRDKMVYVSYQGLRVKGADGRTWIEQLINDGVVEESIADKFGLLSVNQYIS